MKKVVYPEVHSLEESLAILKKYKNELTKEQYENNRSIIGNHAIESIYLNERDIKILVDMDINNLTSQEAIQRSKDRGEFE